MAFPRVLVERTSQKGKRNAIFGIAQLFGAPNRTAAINLTGSLCLAADNGKGAALKVHGIWVTHTLVKPPALRATASAWLR
jgi:hypothetical protein